LVVQFLQQSQSRLLALLQDCPGVQQ
jgi:hypothetical protein